MGIPPARRRDGEGRDAGGGYIHLPPPEHGLTVYCNLYHYGPASGGGAETEDKGVQAVMGTVQGGCGRDADISSEEERTEG